jgi:hypothetical protein
MLKSCRIYENFYPTAAPGKYLVSINGGKLEVIISSYFYAGSFSVFFYACEWQSYVFFFSYRKAYADTFLND